MTGRIHIIFTFLLVCTHGLLCAQELAQDHNLIKKQLPNGLTYYIYPTDRVAGSADIRLFVKAGSLQENDRQRGLAHFLEHMAFNGTRHFKGNDIIRFLESNGAKFGHDLNAHTSYHETIYKLKVPTSDPLVVDTTLTILSDWVDGMALDSTEIEKERGVVLSEWLSKQDPRLEGAHVFLDQLLNNSRHAHRKTIGDTTTLRHFRKGVLKDFYNTWYDPSLMAVAVSGDIDSEQVEQLILDKFAGKKSNFPLAVYYDIPSYPKDSLVIYSDKWTDKTELSYIQLIPPLKEVNTVPMYREYITRNLSNSLFGERFAKLSKHKHAYRDASASIGNFFPVKGAAIATVELDPKAVDQGILEFDREFNRIKKFGFTGQEIEKTKTILLSSFERRVAEQKAPSSSSMIDQMYQDFFYGNRIITPESELQLLRKTLKKIDSVSILHYIRNSFSHHTRYLLTTGDENRSLAGDRDRLLSTIQKGNRASLKPYSEILDIPEKLLSRIPEPGRVISIKDIKEIDAREILLSNGVRVIYKYSALDTDKVLLSGFRAGGLYALEEEEYLPGQYATPIVSLSGYGRFSRETLSHFLAGNSSKAQLLADKTRTGFFASSDHADTESMFRLFYLKWTQPRIDSSAFARVREQSLQKLREKKEDEQSRFRKKLKQLVRGKNYTTAPATETKLREQLHADTLIPIYDKFFGSADGYTMILVTDTPLDTLMPYIKTYLGGLPGEGKQSGYHFIPESPFKKSVDLIEYGADSPRTSVSLVYQNQKKHKDLPGRELLNEMVSSVIKLRLYQYLREDTGKIYGINVSMSTTQTPAPLNRHVISFTCAPGDAEFIIAAIDNTLQSIATGHTDISTELHKVKEQLKKSYRAKKQSNSFWTKSIRDHYFKHYPNWDHVTSYESLVEDVSEREVQRSVKRDLLKSPRIKAIFYPKTYKNQ